MTITREPVDHSTQARRPLRQRPWVVAAVTAVLALALGTFAGARTADPTKSAEYQAQAERLATTESDLAFAEAAMDDARDAQAEAEGTASDAQDQLAAFEDRLDERQAALKKRGADLKKREADLKDRKARLNKRAASLSEREDEVTATEERLAVTTVPGSGTYEVGADIEGGVYRTPGQRGCRYTVFADPEGDQILLDNLTAGPASVSLRAGTWFVSRGCAPWTRQ